MYPSRGGSVSDPKDRYGLHKEDSKRSGLPGWYSLLLWGALGVLVLATPILKVWYLCALLTLFVLLMLAGALMPKGNSTSLTRKVLWVAVVVVAFAATAAGVGYLLGAVFAWGIGG